MLPWLSKCPQAVLLLLMLLPKAYQLLLVLLQLLLRLVLVSMVYQLLVLLLHRGECQKALIKPRLSKPCLTRRTTLKGLLYPRGV